MLPNLPQEIESLNRYVSATFIKTVEEKKSHNKNSRSDKLINSSLI